MVQTTQSRRDFSLALASWWVILLTWTAGVFAGECTYNNPVIPGEFPDPSVIRVGQDYYATATAAGWAPLFSIAHSRDLVHWRFVGSVFHDKPNWSASNYWAPEIVQHRDKFYVYYTARKTDGPLCVGAASSSRPTGPYTDHGPLVCQPDGAIDAAHFADKAGQRYLLWKEDGNSRRLPTPIWIQPLAEDGITLTGEPREMIHNDRPWEGRVVEGPYLFERNRWYYLFYSGGNCCGDLCNYALGVARSRSLEGPWEKHPNNPILASTEDWRCPGHGTIVEDAQGRTFLLYHSYSTQDFVRGGRFGLLDEVVWNADGWPSINTGQGPSVLAASPDTPRDEQTNVDFDDFAEDTLDPAWQWPIGQPPLISLGSQPGGWLELSVPQRAEQDEVEIGRRSPPGKYSVTAMVDMSTLRAGASAGLGAYVSPQQAVALTASPERLTLWSREGGREFVLARIGLPNAKEVHLRMTRTPEAGFRFSYRTGEGEWRAVITLSGTDAVHKPNSAPTRIALMALGGPGSTARFGYVRIERW